ncbi:MAG: hypothetical protein UY06_C0008G0013 [Candidatus Amesbacteria bacterium GW2011_GWA2_47_70]|uniref:PIN domain-containing protein n=1 Tax=Candidatus Amesbacteria bacterium GW2011_GWC2_45_19 TaxID=1618366 RepID=A0A0G1M2P4_9BACT|nr:MAG: hypothetical protein UX05_C0013G0009 [Candidatus Amesbacteria bacterium GW2011_GWC2_45_19]KKU37433.1 MAG: hypothetical protein UX52_C0026G0009 [Candidatus Amesbacteria bacterium GW2011_GWA1_46_35]KKU69016.1 MAG: hypothetical protein UX93_C0003G0008 [Microgenomates group bacterium GW2011_GWC1_47_20]KKU80002.1 MAG: hypothetical protein UY06_C0008G0013 [Candidatus Amesbacteria bacterium GW2011_GWA2_47_70]
MFMARTEEERKRVARQYNAEHKRRSGARWGAVEPDDDPSKLIKVHGRRGRGRVQEVPHQQLGPTKLYAVLDTNVVLEGVGSPGDSDCRNIVCMVEEGKLSLLKMPKIEDEVLRFAEMAAEPESVELDDKARERLYYLMAGAASLFQGNRKDYSNLLPEDPSDAVFIHALNKAGKLFGADRVWLVSRDSDLFRSNNPSILNPSDFIERMKAVGILAL